jgi:hypothetical protein
MPCANLTCKLVDNVALPIGRKSVEYFDHRMPGLVLRVSARGRKAGTPYTVTTVAHDASRSVHIPSSRWMTLEHVHAMHFALCHAALIPAACALTN